MNGHETSAVTPVKQDFKIAKSTRRSDRVKIKMRMNTKFGGEDTYIPYAALDISNHGMFIQSDKERPVGTVISFFHFNFDEGSNVIGGEGVVVRSCIKGDPPGLGIEFVYLNPEGQAYIRKLLEESKPK